MEVVYIFNFINNKYKYLYTSYHYSRTEYSGAVIPDNAWKTLLTTSEAGTVFVFVPVFKMIVLQLGLGY